MHSVELDRATANAESSASVVTVWAAHGGAGASVTALALAEAARTGEKNVALVDLADPTRSGLAGICLREGRTLAAAPNLDAIHTGDREGIAVRRLALNRISRTSASRLPAPHVWLATLAQSVDLVVVDTGYEASSVDDNDELAAWLNISGPVLVGRPTVPSLRRCEGALVTLQRYCRSGPIRLVMNGAPPWPPELMATTGRLTGQSITTRNAIPWDQELEWRGCTTDPLPDTVRQAAARLLARIVPDSVTPPSAFTGQQGRFCSPFRRRPGRG